MEEPEAFLERRLADLIADLKSDDEEVRWDAASDVKDMGTAAAAAVPALIELLLDRRIAEFTFYAKGMAADALGEIGPAARDAIPALLECTRPDSKLPEEGRWLRLRSAAAIFSISSDVLVVRRVVGELTDDPEDWLRAHAANLLEKIQASDS